MTKLHLKLEQGVPQYVCSSCCNCNSILGKSYCSIKNRGCCWYFPKFILHDLHKMVKSEEGLSILNKVLSLPNVKINNYYIQAKGYFDEPGYKIYLKNEYNENEDVRDKSIFFRACPFVLPGAGCTLPVKYRTYICNLFICEDVIKDLEENEILRVYMRERDRYVKWIEWENQSLEILLREKGLNLKDHFDEVVALLSETELDRYEFPDLTPIGPVDEFFIGA